MRKPKQEHRLKLYVAIFIACLGHGSEAEGFQGGGARPLTSCEDVSAAAECASCRVESHLLEEGGDPSMNERKPQIVKDSEAD